MADSVLFSRVMEEYGSQEEEKEEEEEEGKDGKSKEKSGDDKAKSGKKGGLMQAEERLTGSVSTMVYVKYLRYAGGLLWAPIILALLVAYQGVQGMPA